MITKKGSFKFDKLQRNFKNKKTQLPKILGNAAENHFLKGFTQGGKQTNESRAGWQPRKRERKRQDKGRALLVKTGDLRRDLQRRFTSFQRTVIGFRSVLYAIYHNDGTDKMPQREILGLSNVLNRKSIQIINRTLKKLFR